MKKPALISTAVLIAGLAGFAASASACGAASARVGGVQMAQATITTTTPAQPPDQVVITPQPNQLTAPTVGQGAAEPGKIGDEASPMSQLPGRTPGSSASPSSQRANPSRNSNN
jgi:hypothetical protein